MEVSTLFVAVGGTLFGAAIVLLISRTFVRLRPRRGRERAIRLEIRAHTLHEHVHRTEKERPYTAEEVGDALFGNEANDKHDEANDKHGGATDKHDENDRGRSSED